MKVTLYALTLLTFLSGCTQESHETKLTLSSQGSIAKPADLLTLQIGTVTLAATAESALQENSSKMKAVIEAIQKTGLTHKEFQTGDFSIQPTYTPYPKDPPPDWRQKINGYEVRNSLQIRTNQLKLAGALIDAANAAGANSVDNLAFGFNNPEEVRNEAIAQAIKNGLKTAEKSAEAAGLRIKKLKVLNIDSNHSFPIQPTRMFAMKAMNESAPPIESGDLITKADVTLEYEIY